MNRYLNSGGEYDILYIERVFGTKVLTEEERGRCYGDSRGYVYV